MSAAAPLDGVAIVGMAGRFPGADCVDELWGNLLAGRESISRFTREQLDPEVAPELAAAPGYVSARGVIADAEHFDAEFFGLSAREAVHTDPQQRIFLELCWNALEHAGLDPSRYPGSVGVYAGTGNNGYRRLAEARAGPAPVTGSFGSGNFADIIASEKDYVATRVAHKLDLHGPAISLNTACSTSLVAVVQAWYALMSGQCDAALAGGMNIEIPQASGYLPVEGGIESDDGHCRPFDAGANGTLFSSGGAVVVLKRLDDAIAQGDRVYAVIRGVGLNNDGGDKASFSAPSVRGQAQAVTQALASAGVRADSVGYVEAHGTGTPLGDPIEVEALTRAFRADTEARQFCWLGSVKSNFGHLNAASGVVGLVKAVMALQHGRIPPTLHYRKPNPEIDFAASPFKVAAKVVDWPRGPEPRRAGVSSFGVGGTNAHVLLEEAPEAAATRAARPFVLLPLSARDEAGLERRAEALGTALANSDAATLADAAWTLAHGRVRMPVRGFAVAADGAGAQRDLQACRARTAPATPPRLVMLFPGQGSQHAGMARELVASEPVFRQAFERCCALASAHLERDLAALILPAEADAAAAGELLAETRHTQPALFAVEYALAELWASWGIQPDAMIGHSSGEYVAACRAGVFSLEDAVALVCARGAAMQAQPRGAMLAVRSDPESLAGRLPEGVEIAVRNAPELTVLAGRHEAIEACAAALAADDIGVTPLTVSHAFHSAMMEGALAPFRRALDTVSLEPPQRPLHACPEGRPITADEATSPDYWCRQIRRPVCFADSVRHELAQGDSVFLEAGPSRALTGLVRGMLAGGGCAVASLGPAKQPGDAAEQLQRALGALWQAGLEPDWAGYFAGQTRRRVALPGYPFHGPRYWVDPPAAPAVVAGIQTDAAATPAAPTTQAGAPDQESRPLRLAAELRTLFAELSGENLQPQHDETGFLTLGLDSLALTQAATEVGRRYGIQMKFRLLMEDLDNIAALAAMLDENLPPEPEKATAPVASAPVDASAAHSPALTQLIENQRAFVRQQTELLRSLGGVSDAPAQITSSAAATPSPPAAPVVEPTAEAADAPADLGKQPFGAAARIAREAGGELTAGQQRWLDDFTRAYGARTAKSKAFSQAHRARMADPRVVTGFNPAWKELVYPLVVERSEGARLWDIDGNEYIDGLNGFGVNFFGYNAPFITAALHQQLDQGVEIGPQHPLTAEVCELLGELAGLPRVALCNTGSEAVMGAMRLARTVTGRNPIVLFKDSYHGIFDEVIVRGTPSLRSRPAAPGILANAVENVLVLEYGSDEALRIIDERKHELAAVMIEPVQSRAPTRRPKAFVQQLRRLCDAGDCALIFDEVITGLRMGWGGAQAFYDVRADIATYGKVIGGGLPLAALAGQARWMDALDGGDWRFGDASRPEVGVTYFAGTFVRHPLALAAARAALQWLKDQGPALYTDLNRRSAGLIAQLNERFEARGAPLTAEGYSSTFRIRVDTDQPCAGLLWYRLRHEGLHVYEQFNSFLSLAHGDAEVAAIVTAVTAAVDDLMQGGILTPRAAAAYDATGNLFSGFPLSEGQQEKWLGAQYGGNAALAFNEGTMLFLDGALNRPAFEAALQHVWQRHAALRLSVAADGKSQRVHPDLPLPLSTPDCTDGRDDAAAEARFQALCEDGMAQPFDLARPPLVRFVLARLGQDRHGLLIIGHHLVLDGWSYAVLLRELATSYNAFVAGQPPELPPPASYRAWVLAERARRRRDPDDHRLDYWKALYAEPPARLQLPGDRPLPERPDFAADTAFHEFPAALAEGLRQRARELGVTLYSVLLAGFGLLLARLSGQDDLVVWIPVAGQDGADANSLIGDGVNTLPIRLRVPVDAGLATLIQAAHAAKLDTTEHADATLMSIIAATGQPRRGARMPLSGVIFNLDTRVAGLSFDGLDARLRDPRRPGSLWELYLNLNDTGPTLGLELHYASAAFDDATIRAWIGRYQGILQAMLDDPDPDPDDPGADDPGAGADVGVLPTRPAVAPDAPPTLADDASVLAGPSVAVDDTLPAMLERQCRTSPERIAVSCGGRTLSYAQLLQRADAVAAALLADGVHPGERVGVSLARSETMLVALLGVLRAGAAYVPLDPDFPPERLRFMADHAELERLLAWQRQDLADALIADRRVLELEAMPPRPPEHAQLPPIEPDDLAYVLYTSGSTGQPKGVCVRHRNLASFLVGMRVQPGLEADDAVCAVTTLSFDIAALELYLPLVCGARVVLADERQRQDPDALLRLLDEQAVTVLQGTPSLLRMLVERDREQVLGRLRLLVGGEELPRDLAATLLERARELWNLYGPTETTVWSTAMPVQSVVGPVPIGRPIANTRVYLLDEQRRPLKQGELGELWIGGAGVAAGYLFQPELTATCFVPDPFAADGSCMYRSGDLARLRGDVLHFHGRADRQVKLRGFRIELEEIEAAALAAPSVREAVASLQEFGPDDQRLVLYAVSAAGEPADDQLAHRLGATLAPYMLPQHIEWLDALPRTPNGKIDHKALPAPAATPTAAAADGPPSGPRPAAPSQDPLDPREALLTGLWQELIGVDEVHAEDNFFDLGGHSLLAVEMLTRVEDASGVRLNLLDVGTSSLAALARELPEDAASNDRQRPRRSLRKRLRSLLGAGLASLFEAMK